MKIIFISQPIWFYPMKERLGIKDELLKRNIKYEYWSTYYLIDKIPPGKILDRKEIEKKYIFKKIKDIFKKINELDKNTIVFMEESATFIHLQIYRKLLEKNIKLNLVKWGVISNFDNKKYILNLMTRIFNMNIFYILKRVYEKTMFKVYKNKLSSEIKNSDPKINLLYSGEEYKVNFQKTYKIKNKEINFISVMRKDLSDYYQIKKTEENQVVFLDQNLPYHLDFDRRNIQRIEADKYYKKINIFFEYVEKKFNTNVVIAAHPSSNYNTNFFNGRKIIKGETASEIKKSRFIIGHYSAILGLATIDKKPIIFLSMEEFSKEMKDIIKKIAINELNSTLIEFEKFNFNENIELKVDKEKYQKYYKNYLYDEKELKATKDIVLDLIEINS
ncbi:hypothetical protein V6948_04105 [Fusobacterium varium]|uniref:hypothetical protein n=1 Tax=Fusobacterium varium TaxID=856 RepID=UPI002FEE66D6